jgi:ABC-2 type transport system permease protein
MSTDVMVAPGAHAWTRVAALIRLNTALMLREPGPIASRLFMPLIMITVLLPLYQAALAKSGEQAGKCQSVAGMLVMFSLLALSIVGSAILTERQWHTWDRQRATPAAAWELLVGKAVPACVVLVAQQVLIIGFGKFVFGLDTSAVGLIALVVAVWVFALLCLGTALGAFARSHSELAVFYDLGGITLTVLGGALLPLSMMPGWARAISPISPGYWAMRALLAALDGRVDVLSIGVLLTLAFTAGSVACWRITRGWNRSRLM